MAFSSSLPGGRISPPRIRGSRHWPSGSIIRRDKASCIGFLSLVVIVYAGMSLGLVFWNQSAVEESQAVVRPAEARTGASRLQNNAPFGVLPSSPVRDIHDVHGGKSPKGTEATAFGKGIGAGQAGLDKGEESLRGAGGREGDNEATDRAGTGGLITSKMTRAGERAAADPGQIPMEEPFDVTLVSQTSENRFWMLPYLCKRWKGPISIAILEEDRDTLPDDLCPRMIISSTRARSPDDLDPTWYPVNRLRNVAIRAVTTSHFLMTDIDIWPDVNAYNALHMRHRFEREKVEDARSAIVFSAFSRRRFCDMKECTEFADNVPETITELKPCLETNTCGRFDASNQSGQGTAYVYYWRSMLRQPLERSLERIQCFKSHRFEPYLVVRKSAILPTFDERFRGYGKNKIQWINHLRYSGFSFYVMPVNFVIHAPHPKSLAKSVWEKTGGSAQGKNNKVMDQVFESFMTELREEYGEEESISTGLCQKNSEPKKPSKFGKRMPDGTPLVQ